MIKKTIIVSSALQQTIVKIIIKFQILFNKSYTLHI